MLEKKNRNDNGIRSVDPPIATLRRRAQSYADFHYAVATIFGAEEREQETHSVTSLSDRAQEDVDFDDLYAKLEDGILEASDQQYR